LALGRYGDRRYIVTTLKLQRRTNFRKIRTLAYTAASGFDDRAKITILDVCERLRSPQETREGASQQERDDRKNNHDLDERENFLNVFAAQHSKKGAIQIV